MLVYKYQTPVLVQEMDQVPMGISHFSTNVGKDHIDAKQFIELMLTFYSSENKEQTTAEYLFVKIQHLHWILILIENKFSILPLL